MRKIRLDDSCLNHLTNIPVAFTRKSSYMHNSEKSHTQNIMYFADGVRTHLTQLVSLRHCRELITKILSHFIEHLPIEERHICGQTNRT